MKKVTDHFQVILLNPLFHVDPLKRTANYSCFFRIHDPICFRNKAKKCLIIIGRY